MAKQVENWPKAEVVRVRPTWAPGAQATALAMSFALLEAKHPLPAGPADFYQGFLTLEGCSGTAGHQPVVVTAWQGLATDPFSSLCFQLSPAMDSAMTTHKGSPLPWWCVN